MQRINISTRLVAEIVARLDRAARAMSERSGGAEVTRSDVSRVLIERGIGPLERELGLETAETTPAKKGGKPARKP